MKHFLATLVSVLAFAEVLAQGAGEEIVNSSGCGITYRAAVNEALMSALEQHCGAVFSTSERVSITGSETSIVTEAGETSKMETADAISKSIQKWAKGRINGYEVLSDSFDASTKQYRVELAVRVPGRYVVGLDPANRRRMAIVEFRPVGNTFEWYGQQASTIEWVKTLADKLNVRFTKTRRFTMLDRKFDAEISTELARLNDENQSPADVVRRCQKLGTDYLITGEVKFFPVVAPGVNPLTGKALEAGPQLFAEVIYRVLLAPTGQLKFADSVKINAASCPAASIGEFSSLTSDAAASLIIDGVMANYQARDPETDGTEQAPTATPTVNETPVPVTMPTPVRTTVQGTQTGGIKVGF